MYKSGNRDSHKNASISNKIVGHLFSWSMLYICLVLVVSTYFGFSFNDEYENKTLLASAVTKQKVEQLTMSQKIRIEDISTPFNESNEVRLLFSYDSAPCRLFHYEWSAISDSLDVNLAVKQVPVMSSRFMTDTVLKAHAISEQIDFTDKLNNAMYKMVIEEGETINTLGQLHDWFLKEGVNNHKLINYLSNSKTGQLFENYKSIKPKQTPSILVGGSKIIYFEHDVNHEELVEVINAVANQVIAEERL
ncbi:hypothetical protein VIBNIFTn2_120198 [Vibrio nigripulchritudo FTn2]|uniref:hypothetical protein n=1 Tax=Vibrio nigripulchritudo TaxID=28173 RepID=UPI0003B24337|nr:hypothetical protein [Vibrio nigripulchritudo]CCN40216.1 hypothetical protein VIBNIFTn2_120198 [Vibrio nigripulchritudo FTn2]